ncbi:MAG: M3 family oligoendopeptidase [Flavobacteriales bacterium]|nr:M3 family oligoendopeptidase [Flavobacteriales bacterium]
MEMLAPVTRRYLPESVALGDRAAVSQLFEELIAREFGGAAELEQWLLDLSELEAALSEEGAWRYIRMTCDTRDEAATQRYQAFVNEVLPLVEERMDKLHRKLVASPFVGDLRGEGYAVYLRGLREQIRIFREANVPLQTELRNLAQIYSATIGAMNVEWKGETVTLPRAGALLEETDRSVREEAYRLIAARRMQDQEKLNDLYHRMIGIRHQVSANAGFSNYRDYAYAALGRFDHAPADAEAFHQSVERAVVPVVERLEQERSLSLGLDALRPWDLQVDPTGQSPLRPFASSDELIALATTVFDKLHPYFGDCLRTMQRAGRLDLGSREGKAPGGYNYPLYETGAPFIFMNAVGTTDDVVTMLHEGGHAVHSFLSHPLPLTGFKSFPSEVAELASMGMELLTMDHWHLVYPDPADLRRARRDQLERVLSILPWVATIDAFQHEVHTHPEWMPAERTAAWVATYKRFSGNVVDWSGLEEQRSTLWHKQLHLFELPFYYIEYGIAQLGAIAIWRNYKRDPAAAVEAYVSALKLGYTRPLPAIYEAAGIRFDLSQAYVMELVKEVSAELEQLG